MSHAFFENIKNNIAPTAAGALAAVSAASGISASFTFSVILYCMPDPGKERSDEMRYVGGLAVIMTASLVLISGAAASASCIICSKINKTDKPEEHQELTNLIIKV